MIGFSAYTPAMHLPADDEACLIAFDERIAAAVETAYLRLVTGTLRTKRLPPARMALILVSIAGGLLDSAGDPG